MKSINKKGNLSFKNLIEKSLDEKITENLLSSKIPKNELIENLGVFLTSKNLSRILCLDYLYKKQIDIHGNILEFGTRWGQNSCVFTSLRGIYEPYNRHKKIYAFDTFSGFNKISKEDGKSILMKKGNLKTNKSYEKFLSKQISNLESINPMAHIKDKSNILKGDAVKRLKQLLNSRPEMIISMAYFDFDVFKPTYDCLNLIKPRLTKGSVIAFDELNDEDSPGETLALMKTFGLNNIKLKRYKFASRISYFIF